MSKFRLCKLAFSLLPSLLTAGPIGYQQVNLVSDGAVPAVTTDPNLKNPWGIGAGASTPFWVADNATVKSTVYRGDGSNVGLVVATSPAGTPGGPTGIVYSGGAVGGDSLIFANQDGTITGWQSSLGTTAAIRATTPGAIYTGLAIAGSTIFAADFLGGKVDVFNSTYAPVSLGAGAFQDTKLPAGYAPFGIQNLGGSIYVAFAKSDEGEEEKGAGFGFIDKFSTSGTLLQRIVVGDPGNASNPMNAPWGMALAPSGFGDLSGLLLIGNFGDGKINGFNPTTGAFVSSLNDAKGNPIEIDGLWGIAFGNAGPGFDSKKLYFAAGLNDEENGLFGSLQVTTPEPGTFLAVGAGLVLIVRRRSHRGSA